MAPIQLFGQEINPSTFAMARMNAFVHDMEADIQLGDTMHRPAFTRGDSRLRPFDIVTANPMWNLKAKEGENFEFKEAKNNLHFETLAKCCCALANEGGGRVILGVTDKRPRRVVGSTAFDQPERTRKGLCERIPLSIDFEEIYHPDCSPGSRVLAFRVPARPIGTPIKYEGVYWMRKEDSLAPMSEERLREIFAENGRDFSAEICKGAAFGDLDPTPSKISDAGGPPGRSASAIRAWRNIYPP